MNSGLRCFVVGVLASLAGAQSYSLPYLTDSECRNKATEYLSGNLCCSKCRPGTRKVSDCTSERDTVCGACRDGTYSENMNYFSNCFSCSTCHEDKGMENAKPCYRDSDALCVCKPGWYCLFLEHPCTSCERHTKCAPGRGAIRPGTATENVKCGKCPPGTYSNKTSTQPCRPHTRCELQSRAVLIPGTATADAVCGPILSTTPSRVTTCPPLITTRTTLASTEPSTKLAIMVSHHTSSVFSMRLSDHVSLGIWIGLPVAMLLVVLLTAAFCIRHRKARIKPEVHDAIEAGAFKNPDHLCSLAENQVLLADSSSDPSTSLSSDSHSQGTGVSQDFPNVEQPVVSSPVVNLSFTATINCQVNPATGCCSIPISPCVQPPEPEFPLSQEEELCVSCEQEDSKDAIQSVQESGMSNC